MSITTTPIPQAVPLGESRSISADAATPRAVMVFGAGYFLAVRLAEGAYGTLSVPSPFWLPDSVLLCALLLTPKPTWWIFVAAIWPIRLLSGAVPDTPLWFQLASIANDGMKALTVAWMLHRFVGCAVRLRRLKEFLVFLVVAAMVGPALSALAAGPMRYLLGNEIWPATYRWFLGNSVTQVIVTPALLYWCNREYRSPNARIRELLVLLTSLFAASYYAFVLLPDRSVSILIYLPVPFVVWTAIRLRPFGTADAIALVAAVSMISAVRGIGVFATVGTNHSVLSLQLFLLLMGVSLLSLSILVGEREALLRRETEFNGQLLKAQQRERERIASDLHDDFGQRIAMLSIGLDRFTNTSSLPSTSREQLTVLRQEVAQIASDLHHLSHMLHPSLLDVVGVEVALKQLCAQFTRHHRLRIDCSFNNVPKPLEPEVSISLFRIAQEALQNVVKHSGATDASVDLSCQGDQLVLEIADPGIGFNTHVDERQHAGLGLLSMRERVRALSGRLTVKSSPQRGTIVHVELPSHPLSRD